GSNGYDSVLRETKERCNKYQESCKRWKIRHYRG
ncbi:hypothetical protein elemo81A_phanotate1, partial [Flavobacterium phage vB_FspP_elemoA_8-1A]